MQNFICLYFIFLYFLAGETYATCWYWSLNGCHHIITIGGCKCHLSFNRIWCYWRLRAWVCCTCAHHSLLIETYYSIVHSNNLIFTLNCSLMFIHHLFGHFLEPIVFSHMINVFSWIYKLKIPIAFLFKFFSFSIFSIFNFRSLINS